MEARIFFIFSSSIVPSGSNRSHPRFHVAQPQLSANDIRKLSGNLCGPSRTCEFMFTTSSTSLYNTRALFMNSRKQGETTRSSSTTMTFPNRSTLSETPFIIFAASPVFAGFSCISTDLKPFMPLIYALTASTSGLSFSPFAPSAKITSSLFGASGDCRSDATHRSVSSGRL